ncbi:uncharacterized protein LOC120348059 [Styela clava]
MSSSDSIKNIKPEDYPVEVKKCIGEMRQQRERIYNELGRLELERKKLTNDIRFLTTRLAKISQDQAVKTQFRAELDKTIEETEKAYERLLETSRGLCKNARKTQKSTRSLQVSSQRHVTIEQTPRKPSLIPLPRHSSVTAAGNNLQVSSNEEKDKPAENK